ncbi:MAG TPA: NUDIX hydrolase, partial [Beijerinckiaceae bacterium]|nr:NUDIX hydrolase [Beijerinckiaceae bacterium]
GLVGPDSELIELAWVSLADARRLDLPAITHTVLEELENRLALGFAHELPVPFYHMRRERFVRELI